MSGTLCTLGAARCAAAECRVGAGPAGGARARGTPPPPALTPPRLLGGPPPPLGVQEGRDQGADPRWMARLAWDCAGLGAGAGARGSQAGSRWGHTWHVVK